MNQLTWQSQGETYCLSKSNPPEGAVVIDDNYLNSRSAWLAKKSADWAKQYGIAHPVLEGHSFLSMVCTQPKERVYAFYNLYNDLVEENEHERSISKDMIWFFHLSLRRAEFGQYLNEAAERGIRDKVLKNYYACLELVVEESQRLHPDAKPFDVSMLLSGGNQLKEAEKKQTAMPRYSTAAAPKQESVPSSDTNTTKTASKKAGLFSVAKKYRENVGPSTPLTVGMFHDMLEESLK